MDQEQHTEKLGLLACEAFVGVLKFFLNRLLKTEGTAEFELPGVPAAGLLFF